jgi:hypothetical protein
MLLAEKKYQEFSKDGSLSNNVNRIEREAGLQRMLAQLKRVLINIV